MRYDHIGMLPNRAFNPIGKAMSLHGGKGGDAPDAPDYMGLAQQEAKNQQALLEQQTRANRVNQYGPLGSVTYSKDGGGFDQAGYDNAMNNYNSQLNQYNTAKRTSPNPVHYNYEYVTPGTSFDSSVYGANGSMSAPVAPDRNNFNKSGSGLWSQTTTLTPEMQKVLDQNIAAKQQGYGQLQTALGNINNNNLPLAPVNPGETAQDAIMRRINPQLTQQDDALRNRLVNQGLRPGSEGWNREYNLFDQQRNDAYSQAALAGINVGNEARERALAEQGIPLNLINAYQSGGQAQMPQFQNYSQQGVGQSADLMGAAQNSYGAGLNKYNAGQAQDASTMNGLYSLGGAALMAFSDRRLKTDIERIGTYESGLPKYKFKYLWGEESTGAMADEVEQFMPEAVGERFGYKTVNYAMLGV
jgi:hypothetical protein